MMVQLQAIDKFRSAIEQAPNHVVAQCGLAAALLGRARECTGSGALAWAATLLKVFFSTFILLFFCAEPRLEWPDSIYRFFSPIRFLQTSW